MLTGRYYKQVMHRIVEDFGVETICQAQIPVDVNVAKAVDNFMPVTLLNPNSSGSKAFIQLTEELLRRL
jgi:cellulose biosynthesis protein BcsQ